MLKGEGQATTMPICGKPPCAKSSGLRSVYPFVLGCLNLNAADCLLAHCSYLRQRVVGGTEAPPEGYLVFDGFVVQVCVNDVERIAVAFNFVRKR